MATVKLFVLVNGSLVFAPHIEKDNTLAELLFALRETTEFQQLKGVKLSDLLLYKLATPLKTKAFGGSRGVVAACLEARATWIKVDHVIDRVKNLADDEYLSDKFVCLVIELPKVPQDQAVENLKVEHGPLFKCLQIYILNIHSFSWEDVLHNMAVGRDRDRATPAHAFWADGVLRMNSAITQLETDLAEKRLFDAPGPTTNTPSDFAIANRYGDQIVEYFIDCSLRVEDVDAVVDNAREFIAFFALFRCHAKDADRISNMFTSSYMKANHFATHFLLPPFSICRPPHRKTTLHTKLPWKFPIFLATRADPTVWSKLTPNSDFSVCVDGFLCPLLVCEVISDNGESDKWRMLLQGIALARVVHRLKKQESLVPFFVAAVYLCSNLTAQRFIIMQTDPTGKVAIAQTDFDLKNPDRSRDFLKEMFNLQLKLDAMTAELDSAKKEDLRAIARVAAPITSLSQRREEQWILEESSSEESQNEYDFTQDADESWSA